MDEDDLNLLDLLLPRGCGGCDAPDAVLCARCTSLFDHVRRRDMPAASMGETFSCAWYRGEARRAILAWKDHDERELDRPFGRALGTLAVRCGMHGYLATNHKEHMRPLAIVPAPSSPSSARRRGRHHLRPLARTLARTLTDQGIEAKAVDALGMGRASVKSVQASRALDRASRLSGRLEVRRSALKNGLTECEVVLIDDILTTGSTLRQCEAALRQHGVSTLTALTLAQTPPLRGQAEDL